MKRCRYQACMSSMLALLNRKVFDPLHELLGSNRPRFEVVRPVLRSRREDHLFATLANEDLRCRELKLSGKTDSLTPVIHEDLGSSLHSAPPNRAIYVSICQF